MNLYSQAFVLQQRSNKESYNNNIQDHLIDAWNRWTEEYTKGLPVFISFKWYFKENKKHINAVVMALQFVQQLEWITDKQLEWIAIRKFVFRYKC